MAKSFYDLDYIIELNEKRIEEFNGHYKTVHDKYSILIIIYSAIAIFIVQLIQHEINADFQHWLYHLCLSTFIVLYISSIINFIRLLMPKNKAYLHPPKMYYSDLRLQFEAHSGQQAVDNQLKGSYIQELEKTLENVQKLFARKSHFYFNSLKYGLLCIIPFLVCLGFHVARKDDKPYQVEIVNKKILPSNSKIDQNVTKYDTIHTNCRHCSDSNYPATGSARRAGR